MFALSLGKNICHAYSKHIEIKTVTQHNIVYSQRKKLTIWCKFLDIENSVSYNSDTMCGHGGIGRRVRLRGVWDDRVSSSLTGRTKDKQELVFFYASGTLLCTAQRTCGANSHCVSGAQLLCASTLVSLFRHSVPHKYTLAAPRKRTKSTDLVFFMRPVRLVLGFAQRAYGTNSHAVYRDASLFE